MSKVMVLDMKNEVGNGSTLIVHFQATMQEETAYKIITTKTVQESINLTILHDSDFSLHNCNLISPEWQISCIWV